MSDEHSEHEKKVRHAVAELALFALISELVRPSCPCLKMEAARVLFSDPPSKEKMKLADLLRVSLSALDERIKNTLAADGYQNNLH